VKRLLASFLMASAVVLLATDCSGTPNRYSTPKASMASRTPSSSTTTTTAPSPTSTTSTTVSLAGTGNQCTAADLRPSWYGFGNGASEHLFYGVNLENVSGRACVTGGFVGVAAYEPDGQLIPASEQRAPMGPDNALSVASGASVSFSIGFPDVDIEAGGTECSTVVGGLHLIPPNEWTDVAVATPLGTGGWPKLCGNSFLVGPLVMGATGSRP